MVICSRIPDVIIDQLDGEGEEDPAMSRDTSDVLGDKEGASSSADAGDEAVSV